MKLDGFSSIGKILIFIGIGIAVLGLLVFLFPKIPFFGKLPGDINISRENFNFSFPVSISILISIILTIIINVGLFVIFRIRK